MMTENEIYKYYSSKNPNNGKKIDFSQVIKIDNGVKKILLPSWISNSSKDSYYPIKIFAAKLKREYSITSQIYYDIVILGLSSPKDRPKCPCGNYTKFIGIFYGYRTYCNSECMYKFRETNEMFRTYNLGGKAKLGLHHSEETKRKISNSQKGKKKFHVVSEETRRKLSKANKGRKITWKDKQREAALRRIEKDPERALINIKSKRGRKGYYKPNKSQKEMRYLSSWELKFMKMCDLSKDVVEIDSANAIPYTYSGKDRLYIPDFKLTLNNKQIIIVEIKPKNLVNDPIVIAKRITAKKYCRKNNFKYITLTEIELFKRIHGSFSIFDYIV